MNLVIVPCVVGPQMTRACLRSLLAQDVETYVLAINNGANDGTAQVMRAMAAGEKRLSVIEYAARRSLNNVWNEWITWAFEKMQLDYVLVVNNDTVLLPETYRLLRDDGGLFVTAVGTAPEQALMIGDLSQRRPHPDFSCFLIRRACWERVGKFDDGIRAFFGDNDMHIRMHRAGVQAYCLQVPFAHVASGTMKNASNELRDAIQREADADREVFKAKYGFLPTDPEYAEEFKR